MSTETPSDARNGHLTIRDIAQLAGVSPATVSRVINGHPQVSGGLRESVLKVVSEHGYTGHRSSRDVGQRRATGFVGVTLPVLRESYFSVMLAGASEALYEHNLRMVLSPTLHEHDREASLLERLQGTTDGAVLILPQESNEELSALHEAGYPFVIVDPLIAPDDRVPIVSAAHSAGAVAAVDHLLGLGHRRIAAITGPAGGLATEERLRGYRGAIGAAGVMPAPELVVESDFSVASGRRAAERLLSLAERPTAIFAFNDMTAIGAIQAARAHGLEVPRDLSIVGFDDTFEATLVLPALTTVRQPLAEMCRIAVTQLVRLIERRHVEALHIELETTLVVRDSTGPAPLAG